MNFRTSVTLLLVCLVAVIPLVAGKDKSNKRSQDDNRERAIEQWPRVDLSGYDTLFINDCKMSDPKTADRKDQETVELAPHRLADYVANWIPGDAFTTVKRGLPEEGARGIILQIEITEYKPGSIKARSLIVGAGSSKLDFLVHLLDAETGEELSRFGDGRTFAWGGIHGATKSIADMEEKAAQEVGLYLALCRGMEIKGLLAEQRANAAAAGGRPTDGAFGTIHLYRPGKTALGRVRFPLTVDGQAIDQVKNKTYYLLHVDPGSHQLTLRLDRDVYELTVDVKNGETSWVRFGPRGWKMTIESVEKDYEAKDQKKCKLAKELNLTSKTR